MPRATDMPPIGRLRTQCGDDPDGRADSIYAALRRGVPAPWYAKRHRSLAVLWADIVDSKGLVRRLCPKELDNFGWLMGEFYERVRRGALDNYGVVLNFVGDGVLCAFPTPGDIPGDQIPRGPSASARAVLSAVEVAWHVEELVQPGGKFHTHRGLDKEFIRVEVKVAVVADDCIMGNFGPARGRDLTTLLPVDLLALGTAPTFGDEACGLARQDTVRRRYEETRRQGLDKRHREAIAFVEAYESLRSRRTRSTTIFVHDAVMQPALRSREVRRGCAVARIPQPFSVGDFEGDHVFWVVADNGARD